MLRRSIELCLDLRDAPALLYALTSLGVDLALTGDPRRAARVFGAAAAHGESTGQQVTDRVVLDLSAEHRAELARRMGSEAFARALVDGRALTPPDVVAEVWS
jgi:predicted nucleic acid-binding protein